jgi:glutathione synthase/RimK-type ligase-like ATP-grasp enzyme
LGTSLGKWTKHKLLSKEEQLVAFLPETKLLTEKTFEEFLTKYGEAIVKPSKGSLGKGVFKVTDIGNEHYEIHGSNQKEVIIGKTEAFRYVRENVRKLKKRRKRKIIIQQFIPLAKKGEHPFDIRMMLQKKDGEWIISGRAAKVAAKGYFITNAAREVMHVEEIIHKSTINPFLMRTRRIIRRLETVSLLVANTLEEHYPDKNEMGIDVGIDDNGKVWIIEVNMTPSIFLFEILRDRRMIGEILRNRENFSLTSSP